MNYRHAFHAGNFADVVKHIALTLILEHLKLKDKPFFVLDTHAGAGLYDLNQGPATRTGEWRDGIGRLLGDAALSIPAQIEAVIHPYLAAVQGAASAKPLAHYPGSPVLARALMRDGDRLVVNELHPEDRAALADIMARFPKTQVLGQDGYVALKSQLPPSERRGLVLIDPPFEVEDEHARLVSGLKEALERFATGSFLIWYPIKALSVIGRFHQEVRNVIAKPSLIAELYIQAPVDPMLLNGCGLLIVNPPFQLRDQLGAILPWLAQKLAQGSGARHRLTWLEPSA